MVTETTSQSDGNTSFLRAARAGHLDKVLDQLDKNNVDINTSNANGLNALHLASKDGHVHVVTELLKRGANVDSATKKGNTALHIASLAGQEDVVRLLVDSGASVNVQSQNGFTPLYMAAQENHDNVVKFLLASGANQSLATEDGFTPLAVAMQQGHDKIVAVLLENDSRGKVRLPALHIAAKKDDCKAAALLLQNEHNPDVTSKSGFTPLHIASHYGNEGIANLLLTKGADVNYSAKHNITPLHVAAKWGKSNMVSLLLEKGANIESKTRDGLTPLHCAARSGHEQVVDMLLERGAPISSKTKNGLAPLHMSSQGDHVDAARILLYHRAPVDEVTVDYLTALHVAAHCGHARVAKLLLDRKADPNARALNGFTPLHIACKKNRIKVVELLLKHGASIEATTESGLTPLHVASFMGCMNIVIYLLQNEANPDVPTVRGETPLHLAARANQTDIIRILLRNGAQVDARAREQQTPLHIAARLGNFDIVTLLLQHGAAVDSTTKDLYTALHIATKEGQDEVASVLIEHAASLTATTKKGFTPLHLAAKYGNIKVAKLLLQRDAPVDAQGKNGVTPLHVASHYDHQNVALLLLDKGASPHATAKNGHTPLHIAAKKNQMDIATTLLEYGAKSNSESKAGFTPLHLSSQEGHTDMSSLLIDHSADTNKEAKNGLTPLHLCAQEDRVDVARVLVENGAKVDSTTKAGYTPLHVASHFGQLNMVRFLVQHQSDVGATTSVGYTPLHQAAQQGHATIVSHLLENGAPPNEKTNQGQTALSIAQKLGYISVVETLKGVTEPSTITAIASDEKYKVVSPETMQETFMSDSEDEGGEDTLLSEQPYRYLTVDEMKSLGDDSLPIDVTRDERFDSNRECMTVPPTAVDDTISPQHLKENYNQFITPDNVDITKHPLHVGKLQWRNFLVSFLVDARGGAMRGCRHSGVRVIVPPRRAAMPMRVTCRYLKRDKLTHPPPLMEGEALASRILELGPVGAKFLGPVMIEVPHFGSLRGKEREIVILRSDNGETWREHTVEATDEAIQDVLSHSFEKEEMVQLEEGGGGGRSTRILTTDFPHYFAVVTRVRQEVHAIGPEGGMVSSSVVPQVQAVFPQGALTKKIKVGLQAQPIPAELAAKLLGNRVAVSPIVTVEPRRRKFHKPITLTIPVPQAANKGMINQYSGDAPTLRLLCSITGGTTRAQWEDVTGSTPLTFVNDCVSFTTTVSARFWLMDCRNITDATKMATELYREAIHVPFMAKFVVFAKRIDVLEARLRVFCMTDDKEDKTLEHQEHFTEVAKSRDVEVLEGKPQYVEFAANLVPVTKSGDQLQLGFRAFRENRLPFTVRVKDPHAEPIGRTLFMREPKIAKGEPPQQPICVLNIVLPEEIIPETGLPEQELHKYSFIKDSSGLESYQRADLRLSDISNLLGEDWVHLADELGVSSSDINRLKSECPGSVAQQGLAMLRFWVHQADNKASANTLEAALSHIGRDDIVQQCIYNLDQTSFELLKDDRGPSRDVTVKRSIALDRAYEDNIRKAEAEELRRVQERILQREGKEIEKDDKEESKYVAEEKEIEEEEIEEVKKSVSERRKEIEMRLSQEKEKVPKLEKRLSQETKVSTEKEIITLDTTKILDHSSEKEIAEEKKMEPDNDVAEPAELSFAEKRLSFEKGLKQDVAKKAEEKTIDSQKFIFEEQKATAEPDAPASEIKKSFEQQISGKAKEPPKVEKFESVENRKTTDTIAYSDDKHVIISEDKSASGQRRDSELMEGVTETFGRLGMAAYAPQPQDLLSPKVSKTPPPSPAEFKDTTAGTTAWEETSAAQLPQAKSQTAADWANKTGKQNTGAVESSWSLSQEQEQRPTDTSEFSPKPSPRTTSKPETNVENSVKQPEIQQKSDQEEAQDYSVKKKFWEQISSSGEGAEAKTVRQSEPSVPAPVPRPRSSIVSTVSLLKSEAESDTETTITTLSDSTIRLKNVQQDGHSKHSFTGSSDASDKEEVSETDAAEPILPASVPATVPSAVVESTYQDKQSTHSSSSDSESEHNFKSTDKPLPARKSLSLDTDKKSRIPVVTSRKTVYERSVSLPTSDLDTSISSVRAKKRYFEAQIKKEMVVDQLMTQLEEESSPEHKSINQKEHDKPTTDPEAMVSRQIHSHIFSHELDEQIECLVPESKQILEAEKEVVGKPVTVTEEINNKVDARRTVKRTDSTLFEAEIVKLEPVINEEEKEAQIISDNEITNNVKNMRNIFENIPGQQSLTKSIDPKEDLISTDSKIVFNKQTSSNDSNDCIVEKTACQPTVTETIQSKSKILSEHMPESMEVHIDKSEIEESEKEKDLEEILKQAEYSYKFSDKSVHEDDEPIPSITVTLSGKQRTQSYSPGDSEDNQSDTETVPEHSTREEKRPQASESQTESTKMSSGSQEPRVHTPEEHYPDTVWEVPVQQEPETSEQEIAHDIPIENQIIVEKDEEDSSLSDMKQFQNFLNRDRISISEEEAREIAEQVVEDIETKIAEKNIIINNANISDDSSMKKEVTEYLQQLSDDEIDAELVESVIAKKQREQIMKASRKDTTTSSMEITDEDLRSSGVDTDTSLIDTFPTKLKHLDEKSETESLSEIDNIKSNVDGVLRDKEDLEKTLAEVKESLEAAQEELIEEQRKKQDKIDKKESPSEFEFKVMAIDRLKDESIQESHNEEMLSTNESDEIEKTINSESGDHEILDTTSLKNKIETKSYESDLGHQETKINKDQQHTSQETKIDKDHARQEMGVDEETPILEYLEQSAAVNYELNKGENYETKYVSSNLSKNTEDKNMKCETKEENYVNVCEYSEEARKIEQIHDGYKIEKLEDEVNENYSTEKHSKEILVNKFSTKTTKEGILEEMGALITEEYIKYNSEEQTSQFQENQNLIENKDKTYSYTSASTSEMKVYELESNVAESNKYSTISSSSEASAEIYETDTTDSHPECKEFDSKIIKEEMRRTFSDESQKSSQDESIKSPVGLEDALSSSSSSGRKGDSDTMHTLGKPGVVLRKHKTGLSSAERVSSKHERRSGTDYEPYSSSGESHYQSFEQTSESVRTPSRPCSSDIEGLIVGVAGTTGSSEYESAISHEASARSATSHEFHTAVSSLSSRESMKSLDSESSGNLASVEISSEASETLVPSAMELERDMEGVSGHVSDYYASSNKKFTEPYEMDIPHHVIRGESPHHIRSMSDEKDSASFDNSADDLISEEDIELEKDKADDGIPTKMKRSHEMIFQQDLRPASDSPVTEITDDKLGTSLDEATSAISSMSSVSDNAVKTVLEISRTESDKMDGSVTSDQLSLTVSGTSEQLSLSSESHDEPALQQINKMESSTSTQPTTYDNSVSSVTITTSIIKEQGIQSVCTQVTSQSDSGKPMSVDNCQTLNQSNGPAAVEYRSEYDDVKEPRKKPGHRRNESTTFKPSMIPVLSKKSDAKTPKPVEGISCNYIIEDTAESDKYKALSNLTIKEGRNDEKKDIDESEKLEEESYQTEADQGFHREMREARLIMEDSVFSTEDEHEEIKDMYASRPQSQVSKSDSEGGHRHMSSEMSDDRPDSELVELMKQCSSDATMDDPIERPKTPEPPEEPEIKDDTPEFSSEAQASITELELEYCGAFSRSIEYEAHVSPIHEKPTISFETQDHQDDMAEAEAAFHMVPHISPTIPSVLPATIPEDPIAEKHELETREIALKEEMRRRSILAEATSPGSIPDITVTQHLAPLVDRGFHYPDLELEEEEQVAAATTKEESTPDTPASISSKASTESEADQGREYIIDEPDGDNYIAEEPDTAELSMTTEDKTAIENKHEAIIERDSATNSPGSDSFELLEKPDLADDFVIIEEVGKEAHEQDVEGKSVRIGQRRIIKKTIPDEEVKSPPAPATKMTDLKYYPPVKDDLGPFPFESESPPTGDDAQPSAESEEGSPPSDEVQTYDNEVEAGKKWIEMQFQGEQAAAVYGYEFEHGPLEDIKEEEATDFESSSKIGSVGSQVSQSVGSFGSVKESLSSTPDYDVLAGRKYFTRSGEHDDVSMSSLQEFERIEHMIALESTKNKSLGSQDSLNGSGGSSRKHGTNRSGGDDISLSSLKEFEGLEMACIAAEKIESKAKEEEALLSEIEEGHESQASESESCETISAGGIKGGDSDSDDYEKRMFEIDEIIRQAQTNVERFTDIKDSTEVSFLDKTESVGRGDSLEEVSKVPELDLDQPIHTISSASKAYDSSSYTMHWVDESRQTTDSLDGGKKPDQFTISTDSLDIKAGDKTSADAMSASTDSIEYQHQQKKSRGKNDIMTDSIELSNKSNIMSDSLDLDTVKHTDSIDDDDDACGNVVGVHDQSSSSGREGDLSSSGKEDSGEHNRIPPPRAELMLGSTDSLEPTSSTATHATYQYETDSIMSSSFTSGGSNTMVSSTETLDAAARAEIWFEDGKPYVTEVIEPETDEDFSHIIHRTVELPPEIHKVTFQGPDAEKALREYVEKFGPGEDMSETQDVDEHGNVHIKRVVQRRIVIKPDQMTGAAATLSGSELDQYIKHLSEEQMLGEMEALVASEEQTSVTESDFSHLMSSIAVAKSPSHSSESQKEYVTRHIVSQSTVSTPSTSITTTKKEISLIQQKGEKSPSGEIKATSTSSGEPGVTKEGDESPDEKVALDNSSTTDKLLASGGTGANSASASK